MDEIKQEIKKQKLEKTKIPDLRKELFADKEIKEIEEAPTQRRKIDEEMVDEKMTDEKTARALKSGIAQKQTTDANNSQRQRQVKILADLAMEKGINYAVSMAKKIDNAYVLDEFHDLIEDDLCEELKRRGQWKEL